MGPYTNVRTQESVIERAIKKGKYHLNDPYRIPGDDDHR